MLQNIIGTSNALNIQFRGNKKLLPLEPFFATVNSYEQYTEERQSCNTLRLTCTIKPYCTNVLHNYVTEIVQNEGSSNVIVMNYSAITLDETKIIGRKNPKSLTQSVASAIRDTQLSDPTFNTTYYCGIDIFNNHMLRKHVFNTVVPGKTYKSDEFNTLFDNMRDYMGRQLYMWKIHTSGVYSNKQDCKLHTYLSEDVDTFNESVNNNRLEENGWVGFINKGIFKSAQSGTTNYYNVLNYAPACSFIDLYPTRELFSFSPIYNKSRNRLEKNWLYYLTYPYSSTTANIDFINPKLSSLRIVVFDEDYHGKNGNVAIKLTSACKHGLTVNDYINVYKDIDMVIGAAKVVEVLDEYSFTINKNGNTISTEWLDVSDNDVSSYKINGQTYEDNRDGTYVNDSGGRRQVYIINDSHKICLDKNVNEVSFKKIVSGEEVQYYVRLFKKIPNFKFAGVQPTEELLYSSGSDLINQYAREDFANVNSKAAFGRTIYNDEVSQIIYTDDININGLRDNLGRPLSEIYITFLKNNSGYKEWYGKSKTPLNPSSETVEYSHCFGELTCSFHLSEATLRNENLYDNVINLCNLNNWHNEGYDVAYINGEDENDEILSSHTVFYGDLCYYSKVDCLEQSIQMVDFRFNTAQRELDYSDTAYPYLNFITHDEIQYDDWDAEGFKGTSLTITSNIQERREGYYYQPHYLIPIRTYSSELQYMSSQRLTIKSFSPTSDKSVYEISVVENGLVGLSSEIKIFDKDEKILYHGIVKKNYNGRRFLLQLDDFEYNGNFDKARYKLFIKPADVPNYAELRDDGSCIYMWRDIIQNGFDSQDDTVEKYPFTNGALYIHKDINFYLKRQDPKGVTKLQSGSDYQDLKPKVTQEIEKDDYYPRENMSC